MKRYTTEIVVDMGGTLQLLGGKPESERTERPHPTAHASTTQSMRQDLDEIPF
ncbi:hypothetical protein D9M69_709790 [compost metagenome]